MNTEPILLYDATCRFCIANTQRLRRVVGGRIQLVPSGSDEAVALLAGHTLATERQMVLVVGASAYGGAEAVARTLMVSPCWRLAGRLYYLPGLRALADSVYRLIAARRHCLGGACAVTRP